MIHKPRLFFKSSSPKFYQKGAVVILMAFIIGLGAAAYLLKAFNASNLQAEQDKKTYQTLSEAKSALIAWAVSHPNAPGMMPWPDRNTDLDFEGDSAYDGKSDCVTTAFQSSYLLGQLPWRAQSNPCVTPHMGLGVDFRDGQGNRLWYAVSRNLVYDYENAQAPVINPGMINPPHAITPYLRQGGTESYPWLKVLDRNGNLVSDRVAAVIIAPGNPIGGQNRSASAPNASEFLDSFQIGAAVFNNRGYATPDEDFVMGDDGRKVSINDPTFAQPYNFNDKLVYITIDELMAALEKRVGDQVRSSLKSYQDANGYYPYAAHLGTSLNFDLPGEGNLQNGFLPVFPSCNYTVTSATSAALNCTQSIFDVNFLGITQVRFYLPAGDTFTNPSSGSCTKQSSNRRCYCTGTGSCSNAAMTFNCNETSCSATGVGATGDFRIRGGKLTFGSGGCDVTGNLGQFANGCPDDNNRMTCNTANGTVTSYNNGDVDFGAILPSWFKANLWQNYVYYQMTRPALAALSVGARNAEALVVTVGRPINSMPFAPSKIPIPAAQIRPSCNTLNNYLDSVENADGDTVYDATSTQRNSSYNDQNFVVVP